MTSADHLLSEQPCEKIGLKISFSSKAWECFEGIAVLVLFLTTLVDDKLFHCGGEFCNK